MNIEGRMPSLEAQPSPGLRTASKTAGVEPAMSGVSQVVFQDAAETGSGNEPSSAPEGPEEPRHGEASEKGFPELRTLEQRHPAYPEKEQSSWAHQEGHEELQAGQDQAKPGSELGVLPSKFSTAAHEGMQQQGSGETKDQQERRQEPGTAEGQAPDSCQQGSEGQPIPSYQATNGSDTVQSTELPCTLDSCGQQLDYKSPKGAGTPHIRLQGTLPDTGPDGHEDSFLEVMPPMPMTTPKEKPANSFLPSMPEGVKAVETKPVPGPVPLSEVKDIAERRELDKAQKQPQDPTVATGAPNLGTTWQGFMQCLLEVEEEEAMRRRAAKALSNWRSPKTLTPAATTAPVSSSALPLALPQTPASAPTVAPSWAKLPAPGPIPAPVGALVPDSMPVMAPSPVPAPNLSWRKTELLCQSGERNLSYPRARQELGDSTLLKLCQNWEERAEEQLTLKQEEAFRSYFEIFCGQGKVDARSLENILLLVGISLPPAQVEEAVRSADIDGDGHVGFKDFLAVMTDTKRFFCSVEQNTLTDVAPPNPHTLLFEILSLLVEMLALPEAALEEITNYYQRKLKEGTRKAREMESTIGQLRSRKKIPHNLQQADAVEVPERRVLRILSRLKQQNYAANLQSPYAQVPCIPLCPKLDKKMVRRKQGGHYMMNQCTPASMGPDIRSLFKSGSQGSRVHSSDSRKWLSSVPARTH